MFQQLSNLQARPIIYLHDARHFHALCHIQVLRH